MDGVHVYSYMIVWLLYGFISYLTVNLVRGAGFTHGRSRMSRRCAYAT